MDGFALFVIFVMVVIMVVTIVGATKRYLHNNSQCKETFIAKVLLIDDRDSKAFTFGQIGGGINLTRQYYITFDLVNGERKKITVPVLGNESINVGDNGYLTLQGTRFISFKKEIAE